MENFVNNMNDLIAKYFPFKKISKYKLKFKTKTWTIESIQKSISIENALFKDYRSNYRTISLLSNILIKSWKK